jgi:ammonia channel protein AmtB
MDFAGGNVVHICSGCAGTVAMVRDVLHLTVRTAYPSDFYAM